MTCAMCVLAGAANANEPVNKPDFAMKGQKFEQGALQRPTPEQMKQIRKAHEQAFEQKLGLTEVQKLKAKELRKAGGKVYEYTPGFIHAKMLVSDDDMAFVGTINMDFRSLTHHFECGAVLYKNDCIKDIYNDFQHIFEVSQEIDNNFKLSFGAKVAKVLLETFRTLF